MNILTQFQLNEHGSFRIKLTWHSPCWTPNGQSGGTLSWYAFAWFAAYTTGDWKSIRSSLLGCKHDFITLNEYGKNMLLVCPRKHPFNVILATVSIWSKLRVNCASARKSFVNEKFFVKVQEE